MVSTLFISIVSLGQTDFRPGYYITWDNDTVHGLIDNRGDSRNSKFCAFKRTENAEEERFYPREIQSYRFNDGKYYISKNIESTDDAQGVFLEFLLSGYKNLYFHGDIDNYAYFIEEKDGRLVSLKKETIFYELEGKKLAQQDFRYIGVLKATLYDCPEIQSDIDKIQLTHNSLIKLLKKYNDCVCDDNCVVYEKMMLPTVKFQFAPVVGFGIADFYTDKDFEPNYTFDSDYYVSFGLLINTMFPRISKSLSLQLEILYFKNDFQLLNVNDRGSFVSKSDVQINSVSLQPSFALKYTYPKGRIKPSIAFGIIVHQFLNYETSYIQYKEYSTGTFSTDLGSFPIGRTKGGGLIQLGCNYKLFKNTELFTHVRFSNCTGNEPQIIGVPPNNLWDHTINKYLKQIHFSFGVYLN